MLRADFIFYTQKLIDNRVFMGRSSNLENSLRIICDALEGGTLITEELSAQVTAGWYAEKQEKITESALTPVAAWAFMYDQMGRLTNNVYKLQYRQKLAGEFAKDDSYPEEFKDLWNTVFLDREGPDMTSRYARLDQFITDRPGCEIDNSSPTDTHKLRRDAGFRESNSNMDFHFLLDAGQALLMTACVVSFNIAALALMSLITISSTQLGIALTIGCFSAACSLTFFTHPADASTCGSAADSTPGLRS